MRRARSIKIGTISGTAIRVDYSWLLVFGLVTWSLAAVYLPSGYPGWATVKYWLIAVVGSGLLFVAVTLHEVAHAIVAMHLRYHIPSITLQRLGGVPRTEPRIQRPKDGFWIAALGPVTSLVIGVALLIVYKAMGNGGNESIRALALYLGGANLALAALNLLPGFPMDGGRLLQSIAWHTTGSLPRATAISCSAGTISGAGLIVVAVLVAVTSHVVTGLWLGLVGWRLLATSSNIRRRFIAN